LKEKVDSTQVVKNYLMYLKTQGQHSKGIEIDCGKEFMNENLEKWCSEHGIEIRLTVPYSPSQNGITEHMNRTLVELSCAMITGNQLPEFLWEYMVLHVAYIHNRSYTKHLPKSMPYEGWHNAKPNVSHLCEFGSPTWILLQGQKKPQKMLPKSKQQAYVGYDDGTKVIKYYNAATHKVLTSRNFHNLTISEWSSSPEHIELTSDSLCEGESGRNTLLMGVPEINGTDDLTQNPEPEPGVSGINGTDDLTQNPEPEPRTK
jgi:hypothetical protein